jgi:hypothetical protein
MGDDDDTYALASQIAEVLKEFCRLATAQSRGGLIEDQQAAASIQGGGDFDHLLLANPQPTHRQVGIDLTQAKTLESRPRLRSQWMASQPTPAMWQPRQEKILRHRERGDEIQFLLDDLDTLGFGRLLVGRPILNPGELHGRFVGWQQARKDSAEGTFPRSIRPQQRMDLSRLYRKMLAVEDGSVTVSLDDLVAREKGWHIDCRRWCYCPSVSAVTRSIGV